MAIIYCNKSGLDANSGATAALAKLTITAAVTAAGSGGTVIVGSGWYNEKIILPAINATTTFYADGNVVVDGQGQSVGYLITPTQTNQCYLSFLPYTSGGGWTFKNSPANMIFYWAALNNLTLNFTNCIFLGGGITQYAINTNASDAVISGNFQNCIFSGFTTEAVHIGVYYGDIPSINFVQNTFYNSPIAIRFLVGQGTGTAQYTGIIRQNIFSTGTTALQFQNAVTTNASNIAQNNYYAYTNFLINGGSTYTVAGGISAIQALNFEIGGFVANPNFTDATNNIFYLTQQIAAFPIVAQVGAYPYGYTQGANNNSTGTWNIIAGAGHDNSGWYNPDGNVTKDVTTGNLILSSGTSGIIWSPVVNSGIVGCKTTELDIAGIQVYPTNMIDSTLADVRPNYQTSEVRASDTIFTQNDGVLAWTTIKNNIPFTAISGRYIQCRITLTTLDGQG